MRHRLILSALLALLAPCAAAPLAAQDSAQATRKLCYRGRALPQCSRFVITEIGYYRRAAGSRETYTYTYPTTDGGQQEYSFTENDIGSQLTFEVGLMANRGPRSALGATLLLGAASDGAEVGLKGRYRRWLSSDGIALDVGLGVVSGGGNSRNGATTGNGITADVALNAADYGAIVLRTDALRVHGHTASAVYGGVRLGSGPALIGTGVLAVGLLLVVAALSRGDY